MPPAPPIAALLLMFSACVHAQSRAGPLEARAPVPPVIHKSLPPKLAEDPPPADWRAANERVARVGGWRSYAREKLPEVPQ